MSTEAVLLLGLYAFLLLGVFFSEAGPMRTFAHSTPRLAAHIERDISIGKPFVNGRTGAAFVTWSDPR